MIPLKDKNPSGTFPFVNYVLIASNILVFVYELSLGSGLNSFFVKYGLVPSRYFILAAEHSHIVGRFVPFFTSMFIHGGWLHIIGNMWFLFIFGDNVEDRFGHGRYLVFYILCGLAAAALQTFLSAGSDVPTIGASGAISGVLGAYLIMFPKARIVTLLPIFFFFSVIDLSALIFIGIWFLLQLFSGLGSYGMGTSGGVAWWAHVGGFVAGIAIVPLFRKKRFTF